MTNMFICDTKNLQLNINNMELAELSELNQSLAIAEKKLKLVKDSIKHELLSRYESCARNALKSESKKHGTFTVFDEYQNEIVSICMSKKVSWDENALLEVYSSNSSLRPFFNVKIGMDERIYNKLPDTAKALLSPAREVSSNKPTVKFK